MSLKYFGAKRLDPQLNGSLHFCLPVTKSQVCTCTQILLMTATLQVYINRLTLKHVIPFFQSFNKMSSRRDNLKRKATAAAEVKAKRLKGETDLGDNLKWEHVGEIVKSVCPLIVLSSSTLPGRQKVAGFDIDFTVIKTASGRRFATGIFSTEYRNNVITSMGFINVVPELVERVI